MMGTKIAIEALAAEREAAEVEGIFSPTPEQRAELARRKVLLARKAKIDAEISAIENAIEKDMRDNGKRAIAVDGKNLALISTVTKRVVMIDEQAMEKQFPEVVAAHRQYEQIVPLFRTETREPNGDRVTFGK